MRCCVGFLHQDALLFNCFYHVPIAPCFTQLLWLLFMLVPSSAKSFLFSSSCRFLEFWDLSPSQKVLDQWFMLCFFGSYEVLEVNAVTLLLELDLSLRCPLQSCGYLNSQTTDVSALLSWHVLYIDFQIVALFSKYRRCLWPTQFDGSCTLEVWWRWRLEGMGSMCLHGADALLLGNINTQTRN